MEDGLRHASILPDDLKGKVMVQEVVEDACVVAGYVHLHELDLGIAQLSGSTSSSITHGSTMVGASTLRHGLSFSSHKRDEERSMLKAEKISARTIRYILTPEGIKEKAESTYRYIVSSIKYINEVDKSIEKLVNSTISDRAESAVLFGPKDEIWQLLTRKLDQLKIKP